MANQQRDLATLPEDDRPRVLRVDMALAWLLLPAVLAINLGIICLLAPLARVRWTPMECLIVSGLIVGAFIAGTPRAIREGRKLLRRDSSCLP
jgi:hypothetical protein